MGWLVGEAVGGMVIVGSGVAVAVGDGAAGEATGLVAVGVGVISVAVGEGRMTAAVGIRVGNT
jgi:hypothetical protein